MQTFYDISLVDGYNLPVGLRYLPGQNTSDVRPNLTNIACIATAGYLSQAGGMGITTNTTTATNDSYPIPLESEVTNEALESWCPWELQSSVPKKPGSGIYPYPDDNLERPVFDPCLSACEKTQSDEDCCRGHHNTPDTCQPSLYSQQAKTVCPDAYSFAYDDHKSTFMVPKGGGWEIIFCPVGRSTNILATFGDLWDAVQSGAAGPIKFEDDDKTPEPEEVGSDAPASDTNHVTASDTNHVTASDINHVTASDTSHVTPDQTNQLTTSHTSHVTASEVDNNPLPPTLPDTGPEGGDVPSPEPSIGTAPEAPRTSTESSNDITFCEDSVDDVETIASPSSEAQSIASFATSNTNPEPPPVEVSTTVTSQKDGESTTQQRTTSTTALQETSTMSSIVLPTTTITATSERQPGGDNPPSSDSAGTVNENGASPDFHGRGIVVAPNIIMAGLGPLVAAIFF